MRLPVHLQREIARLHFYDPRQSNRSLADMLTVAPNTVASMRKRLRASTKSWSDLQPLDDVAWRAALGTQDRSIAVRKPAPDWQWVHAEMQRPDATLEQLWREWREARPDGVAYTQFSTGYRAWVRQRHVVMRRVHAPGDKLFVDFAGRTVEVRDATGGPSTFAQIFVAVLGYSNFTYIEAVATQTTADWVKCHVNCLRELGGVPAWVVPDNLKAAVWRRERDRIVLNPVYRECLSHYDTAALPARPRRPRDKGKAEVGVQIAQRWVLFRLRDRVFFDLAELNEELKRLTRELNAHPFKSIGGCRSERFALERRALKPLPVAEFELCDWKYGVRVGNDHHVQLDRSFYSVPCALAGERVDLRYTAQTLEVLHAGRRVALHALSTSPDAVITVPEHRPIAHTRVLEGEPKALAQWAAGVGTKTLAMIRYHLEQRSDVTNGLRAAQKLRELARLHGDARFEEVCVYALGLNITALRSIESILRQEADRRHRAQHNGTVPATHENLRGASYYKEAP
jgi:transposase